jgi:hypothetical protein
LLPFLGVSSLNFGRDDEGRVAVSVLSDGEERDRAEKAQAAAARGANIALWISGAELADTGKA